MCSSISLPLLVLCDSSSDSKPSLEYISSLDIGVRDVANLSVIDLLARRASRMLDRSKVYIDDAHTRTQSYFLSATDASGRHYVQASCRHVRSCG